MRIELKNIDWITDATIKVYPPAFTYYYELPDSVISKLPRIWAEDICEKRLMSANYFSNGVLVTTGNLIRTVLKIPGFSRTKITWYSIDVKSFNGVNKVGSEKLLLLSRSPENIANSFSGGYSYESYENAYIIFNREDKINEILE